MKRPVEKRLKEEVAKFFNSHKKSGSFSIDEYATEFLAQKLELVREWDIAHLCLMFRAEARLPKDQPFQMFLPGYRGDLDERIPVEKGVRLQIGEATVSDLRENLKVMKSVAKSKLDPKIEERQRFIDDMALYSHAHRGLTVAEYCELKAAGVPPPVRAQCEEEGRGEEGEKVMKKTDVEKRADKKFFDIFTNSDATSLEELQAEFEKSDPALSRELTIELLTRHIEEIRKPANFGQTCRPPGSPPLSPREKRDKLYELIKKQLEKDIRAMRVQNRKDMVTAEEILELRASLRARAAKKKRK